MKHFLQFLALMMVAFVLIAATHPAKTNLPSKTTIYADRDTFSATATPVETLTWTKARGFTDTSYTCAFVATGGTATGTLKVVPLDDSTLLVSTSAATDSNKTISWMVVVQKH